MTARPDALAYDKEILLAHSALCRLRVRRDAQDLRDSLHWKRVAIAASAAPAVHAVVLGLAVSFAGLERTARIVRLAGRIVLFAKLAGVFIEGTRRLAGSPAWKDMCATGQTSPGSAPSVNDPPMRRA